MAKNGTKKTFQTSQFSVTILRYVEADIDYRSIILFIEWCFNIMHKNFKANLTKIKGVKAIFVISPIATILVNR